MAPDLLERDEAYQALVLAALFHDIGKLLQREASPADRQRVADAYRWFDPGRPGTVHEMWGADFARRLLPGWTQVETLILRHHCPESELETLLQAADHLAAGERDEDPGSEAVATSPLVNILSRVAFVKEGVPAPERFAYLPLRPLEVEASALFPCTDPGEALRPGDYPRLQEGLRQALERRVRADSFREDVARLLYVLQRWLWAVPSAVYRTVPDISLYDHQKVTAAVAACLYLAWKRQALSARVALRPGEHPDEPVLLLVGGDISGVQAFLYNVGYRGALRALKGRSAYLQLLTWALAHGLAAWLDLPDANVLYAAGGHFFLLAPVDAGPAVEAYGREVQQVLWAAHGGELAAIIDAQPLRPAELQLGALGKPWSALLARLRDGKERRWLSVLHDDPTGVLGPFGEGGVRPRCAWCRQELAGEEPPSEEEGEPTCAWCRSFGELGRRLAHLGPGGFLVGRRVALRRPQGSYRGWEEVLAALGWEVGLRREAGGPTERSLSLGGFPAEGSGWLPLAVHAPLAEGRIREFEEIGKAARGLKRWGVLRADVDDLGRVFAVGLGAHQSLSRYATLSTLLSLFFGAWVDRRVRDLGGPRAYTIYSGGDDLFVVGSWDLLPELAHALREEFRAFCAGNSHLTLSASIEVPPTDQYPLRAVALEAGESLDRRAKRLRRQRDGHAVSKDAASLLGVPLGWEEWPAIEALQRELVALVEAGVARRLLQLVMAAHPPTSDVRQEEPQRVWRLHYQLHRLAERHPDHAVAIRALGQWLLVDHYRLRPKIGAAARWAELLTRKEVEPR